MKAPTLRLLPLLLSFYLLAPLQAQEKGATPLATPPPSGGGRGEVRAVVVGISDYQDAAIPDLRFADRDAEAFANFLRSPAGGSLDGDHLKLLTNQNATAGRIAEALDGLLEQVKEGDQVIIYFSGHGDVERKTVSQPGFLLAWDAPSRVYMGGGTYSLAFLQEIVNTLSTQNLAKVIVITDACHAGKLAGSQIGGAKLTSANLAKQYANEVKILSCQPNEFSLEGEQWGGGRGAFSYHLVEGLFGLADRDSNGAVSLSEIFRYLEDHVTPEVAPQSQVPIVLGNMTERLATVDPTILTDLKKAKSAGLPLFTATEGKGLEEVALAGVDSSILPLYLGFKKAIQEKRFLEPADDCAEKFYALLIKNESLTPLHGMMRRNYAAALQDDAQQALNAYLTADSMEMADRYKRDRKYSEYPRYLGRAAELLGEKHYMYRYLVSRQLYFEGVGLRMKGTFWGKNDSIYHLALDKQTMALSHEPNAPYVLQELGQVHQSLRQFDQALAFYEQAVQAAPAWVIPLLDISRLYNYHLFDKREKSIEYASMAAELAPDNLDVQLTLATVLQNSGKPDSAEAVYLRTFEHWPQNHKVYAQLAGFYATTERFEESKKLLEQAVAMFPDKAYLYYALGQHYRWREWNPPLAIQNYLKSIELDSTYITSYWLISQIYKYTEKLDSSIAIAQRGLEIQPNHSGLLGDIGRTYFDIGDYPSAEKYYRKAIEVTPNYAYPHRDLGKIQLRLYKDTMAAKAFFIKAVSLSAWWGCNDLARIYFIENKPDSAFMVLEKGVEENPTWFEGIHWNGVTLRFNGYYREAIATYEKAFRFNPKSPSAFFYIAFIHELAGHLDSAILVNQRNIELTPDFSGAYAQLSRCYQKKGMENEAIDMLNKAIEKSPEIGLYHQLAQIYLEKGDSTNALSLYRIILNKGTKEPMEQYMICLAKYHLGIPDALDYCTKNVESLSQRLAFWEQYYYQLAALYALIGDTQTAIHYLEKALESGYNDFQKILADLELKTLWNEPAFKKIMKQYFPYHYAQHH